MNDVIWQSEDKEWLEKVRIFLLEIAQAYLSDTPRLPETLSQKIVPLSQKSQAIRKNYQDESGYINRDNPDLLWIDEVSQFLRKLSGVYLSADGLSLPEDLSHQALNLAKEAKRIQQHPHKVQLSSSTPVANSSAHAEEQRLQPSVGADLSIEDLQKKMKIQWANSANPNAPEWQQLIVLLDVAKGLYQNLV